MILTIEIKLIAVWVLMHISLVICYFMVKEMMRVEMKKLDRPSDQTKSQLDILNILDLLTKKMKEFEENIK